MLTVWLFLRDIGAQQETECQTLGDNQIILLKHGMGSDKHLSVHVFKVHLFIMKLHFSFMVQCFLKALEILLDREQ